jgi:hypothetical protein
MIEITNPKSHHLPTLKPQSLETWSNKLHHGRQEGIAFATPARKMIKASLGCLEGRMQQIVDHKLHGIQNKDRQVEP